MEHSTDYKQLLIDTLCDLVRIPSCSYAGGGDEQEVQTFVANSMRDLGADVRTFQAGDYPEFFDHPLCCGPGRNYTNRPTVIAELGPTDAPALLVLAHSDTVSINNEPEKWTDDPFTPVVRDGRVYGRGAGDDKWGTASMLMIMQMLRDSGAVLSKRLIFASTMDEENGVGNGLLLLMCAGIEADAALYLDGCGMQITIGNLGGSNIHMRPGDDVSPEQFDADAAAIEALTQRFSQSRAGRFDQPMWRENRQREASVCFRRLDDERGPFLQIPFYTLPDDDGDAIHDWLMSSLAEILGDRFDDYTINCRVPWFDPTVLDPDFPLVRCMSQAFAQVTGDKPQVTTLAKQDSFVLRKYMRIPTVSFGTSHAFGPGAIHEPDECVVIDEAWTGLQIAHHAIRQWLEAP